MDFSSIFILIVLFSIAFYVLFTLLGLGGIKNNREAQDLDNKGKN
tara:strand:+ start:818 stop:952 length:135 start_codon:yes stop_codon:yes gene_type:complete